jgi:hypothetical protein
MFRKLLNGVQVDSKCQENLAAIILEGLSTLLPSNDLTVSLYGIRGWQTYYATTNESTASQASSANAVYCTSRTLV